MSEQDANKTNAQEQDVQKIIHQIPTLQEFECQFICQVLVHERALSRNQCALACALVA